MNKHLNDFYPSCDIGYTKKTTKNKARWWFQRFFILTPITGEMIQFDEHIFQMGWNHYPPWN